MMSKLCPAAQNELKLEKLGISAYISVNFIPKAEKRDENGKHC